MRVETGLHAGLTRTIIGAAQRVYRVLGSGFLERVYHNALFLELQKHGLSVQSGVPIDVRYEGDIVGVYEADLVVNDLVIVQLKAVEELIAIHEVQLVNYLRATRMEVGFLINLRPPV